MKNSEAAKNSNQDRSLFERKIEPKHINESEGGCGKRR